MTTSKKQNKSRQNSPNLSVLQRFEIKSSRIKLPPCVRNAYFLTIDVCFVSAEVPRTCHDALRVTRSSCDGRFVQAFVHRAHDCGAAQFETRRLARLLGFRR